MDFQLTDFGVPLTIKSFDLHDNQFELIFGDIYKTKQYYYKFQDDDDDPITVGITTFGKVAVWKNKRNRIELIDWGDAEQISDKSISFSEISSVYKQINCLMRQYIYRYRVIPFSCDSYLNVEYIEDTLYDGTLDKVHDDRLFKYHNSGIPHRLHISSNEGVYDCQIYFWFDKNLISNFFSRFYGAHRETKTDFIIRIDAENKKYELALYRQGLKEPVVIPESAYELIVFKNKFEDYRSENYNQPRGAWIW